MTMIQVSSLALLAAVFAWYPVKFVGTKGSQLQHMHSQQTTMWQAQVGFSLISSLFESSLTDKKDQNECLASTSHKQALWLAATDTLYIQMIPQADCSGLSSLKLPLVCAAALLGSQVKQACQPQSRTCFAVKLPFL